MGFDPANIVSDFGDPEGEARACRSAAALFDFSFMARAVVSGPGALAALAGITRRPLADLPVGRIRYALRETPQGYLAADLTVWRIAQDTYELMSGRPVDIADLIAAAAAQPATTARDLTAATNIFAVQGPGALDALRPLAAPAEFERLAALPYYATADVILAGTPIRVGRLGYTGERGFELLVPKDAGRAMWSALAARTRPAGFIAADMLRIEAGFVLFANEFRMPVTAAEAGFASFVPSPHGSTSSHPLTLACFRASTSADVALYQPHRALSRPAEPDQIVITSACRSLEAGGILGLGFVHRNHTPGRSLQDPSGIFNEIELVSRPFYDPEKRRPRGPWQL